MDTLEIKEIQAIDVPYNLLFLADPSDASINTYLERSIIYGAFNEKQIVGVILLLPTTPFCIEIINIAVDEAWQGKGIGKKLIEKGIQISKESGYKRLEVGTGNSSINQIYFYQKNGFRPFEIHENYFAKYYDDKIVENGIQCRDMIRFYMTLGG